MKLENSQGRMHCHLDNKQGHNHQEGLHYIGEYKEDCASVRLENRLVK